MGLITFSFVLCSIFVACRCQIVGPITAPIPIVARQPGTVYGSGLSNAKVTIEAFLEILCSDSRAAWPQLMQVAATYEGSDVRLLIHQHPLPYHRNAYVATQGFHLIEDKTSPADAFTYMEQVMLRLADFGASATANETMTETISALADIAAQYTPITKDEFITGLSNYSSWTIETWKHGVRRGIAGTPWYYVNGVDLAINPSSSIRFNDWQTLIDFLLAQETK